MINSYKNLLNKLYKIIILFIIVSLSYNSFSSSNINNESLYKIVAEKLSFDPKINASNITILIKGNADIVILGGTVQNYAEKDIAETDVKNIKGVRAVVNEISVSSVAWTRDHSDMEIADAILHMMKWHVCIPHENITIVVKKGNVILSGEVRWNYQKKLAYKIASHVYGVMSITNNINLIKQTGKIDIIKVKQQITTDIFHHTLIRSDDINVTVVGKKVILQGKVHSLNEKDVAEIISWSVPGIESVENKLVLDF